MRKRVLFLLFAFVYFFNGSAFAADIIKDGTTIIGIDGLVIGSTIYNVDFLDGTCLDLFDGCNDDDDFFFQEEDEAEDAAQSIVDILAGQEPEDVSGCIFTGNCQIRVYFDPTGVTVDRFNAVIRDPNAGLVALVTRGGSDAGISYDTGALGSGINETTAVFEEVGQIPLPAAGLLFVSAALMAMTRRMLVPAKA
ncbi:MAG: hypothetical protein AAF225_04855 [Pseudomonadota bacterium]